MNIQSIGNNIFIFVFYYAYRGRQKTKIVKTDFQGVRLKTVYLTVFTVIQHAIRREFERNEFH